VANRVFAIRLVQSLGWVFETQERKKRKKDLEVANPAASARAGLRKAKTER